VPNVGRLSVRQRIPRFAVVLALFATAGQTSRAGAAPRVQIRWAPAVGCPSEDWFLRRIEAFLGRSRKAAATRDLVIHVQVTREADRFVGNLDWEDSSGREQRELDDPDCLVLADASAFVVASAIDPLVTYERAEPLADVAPSKPEDAKAAEPPPPDAPEIEIEVEETPLPRTESRPIPSRLAVGPRVEGRSGLLPELTLLIGATGEFTTGRARGAAAITASLPRDSQLTPAASASYFATVATLEGCWLFVRGAVEIPGCVTLEGAVTRGRGRDVSDPETAWLPWVSLGAGSSLRKELDSGWAARVSANAGWVAVRPRFTFNDVPVAEPSGWAAALAVSLEWRFR
jgi:hypothetical protein